MCCIISCLQRRREKSHLVSTSKNSYVGYEVSFTKGQCFLDYVSVNKGVSDLKYCLDYCENPARSCENLNFCFLAQTELTEKKPDLNFFERLLDFSQKYIMFVCLFVSWVGMGAVRHPPLPDESYPYLQKSP